MHWWCTSESLTSLILRSNFLILTCEILCAIHADAFSTPFLSGSSLLFRSLSHLTRVGTGLTTSTDTTKNKILSVYLNRLVQKFSPCRNFVYSTGEIHFKRCLALSSIFLPQALHIDRDSQFQASTALHLCQVNWGVLHPLHFWGLRYTHISLHPA